MALRRVRQKFVPPARVADLSSRGQSVGGNFGFKVALVAHRQKHCGAFSPRGGIPVSNIPKHALQYPTSSRRELVELSDGVATRVQAF
jgi:hypothetical protein